MRAVRVRSPTLSNQSRNELSARLMKNCEPPLFSVPVLAMLSVYLTLDFRQVCSSVIVPASPRLTFVPASGPAVITPGQSRAA